MAQSALASDRVTRFLLVSALTLALTGCQASPPDNTTADPPPTTVTFGPTATGLADDGDGHSAVVDVAVGQPQPAAAVTEALACTAAFGSGQEVTVPVEISVTSRSVSSMPITLSTGEVNGLTSDGHATLPDVGIRWSVKYSDTPQVCKDQGVLGVNVRWSSAQPGVRQTFVAWMVLSQGITDNDTSGAATAGAIVFNPTINFGSQSTSPRFDNNSKQVVQCLNYGAETPSAYIALVPGLAVHHGCTSATVGDLVEAEHDTVCRTAFPDQSSRTADRVTLYSRTASLFQVCEGFGSDHVTLTTEMTCAMIAVIADQLGERAGDQVHQVSNLCTADSTIRALSDGSWATEAKKAGCEYIGGVFAEGLAIAAAGASGPGALVVGPVAYQALNAGVSLACDGDLRNAVQTFGYYIEAHAEAKVAKAISADADLCMRNDPTATIEQWTAVSCA